MTLYLLSVELPSVLQVYPTEWIRNTLGSSTDGKYKIPKRFAGQLIKELIEINLSRDLKSYYTVLEATF